LGGGGQGTSSQSQPDTSSCGKQRSREGSDAKVCDKGKERDTGGKEPRIKITKQGGAGGGGKKKNDRSTNAYTRKEWKEHA